MRLPPSHKPQSSEAFRKNPFIFIGCYKWMLWFVVSLYFLFSFSCTHKPTPIPIPIPATKRFPDSESFVSRALLEPSNFSRSSAPNPPSSIKIYVYDLPPRFNSEWLANNRCSSHLFAAEVALHRALLNYEATRTRNPNLADFFFVPVYVSCNFSTTNGFPSIGHARPLLSSAVSLISSSSPFWNRSLGSDHIFVASHDYGACFHAMEDRAKEEGIPSFMKNSIILQTFGVNYDHPCQSHNSIIIPPFVSPETAAFGSRSRNIFSFFRGKMEVHPKNVNGRYYGKKVRTEIWRRFNGDQRFRLRRHRFAGYQTEIARSVFCLCPLGWAPWSPRLVESVIYGCVPVIIADGIRLPFPGTVPWPEISLTVPERDVGELGNILQHVAATNLSTIQRNLWNPAVSRALLFHDKVVAGDATWHVISSLSSMRRRSHRVFSQ